MLQDELLKLAVAIRNVVLERRQNGLIPTRVIPQIKRRAFSLKYRDDLQLESFEPVRSNLEIWDHSDREEFQRSFLRSSVEYSKLSVLLESNTAQLNQFVRSVFFTAFDGLDNEELQAQVDSFLLQIEGKPLPMKITAFIDGISIASASLWISDTILLRKPTREDLTELTYLGEFGELNFPNGDTWFQLIGEFFFDAISPGLAQREFLRIVDAFRLFRVGGVATQRYSFESRHLFPAGMLYSPSGHGQFRYKIFNYEAKKLAGFIESIVPILPDPFRTKETDTDIEIAYSRYIDALFQAGSPEKAITSAITALEALFLVNEPELMHRLAQRSAMFMKLLGASVNAKTIYSDIKTAYKIRSTFIHGGSLPKKERSIAEAQAPIILDYTRRCVLARLQQKSGLSKKDMLKQLDDSMIDTATARSFKRTLSKMIIF